jgi:hypothetical protein
MQQLDVVEMAVVKVMLLLTGDHILAMVVRVFLHSWR